MTIKQYDQSQNYIDGSELLIEKIKSNANGKYNSINSITLNKSTHFIKMELHYGNVLTNYGSYGELSFEDVMLVEHNEIQGEVVFSPSSLHMKLNDVYEVGLDGHFIGIIDKELEFEVSKSGVIELTDGIVNARNVGESEIRVYSKYSGELLDKCKVKVWEDDIPIETISCDDVVSITLDKKKLLNVVKSPVNSTEQINWIVEDPEIATVSKYGVVTGKKSWEHKKLEQLLKAMMSKK